MHKKTFGQPIIKSSNGKDIYAKTHNQLELCKSVENNQITILSGPAGSGKTFMSSVLAAKYLALKDSGIEKIIICRPAIEAGENLGFLPGDLSEKLNPYLRPIYDILDLIYKKEYTKKESDSEVKYASKIEIVPFAFMRGRSFHNTFIIADEMQNCTKEQMRLLMTRIGKNSKMIIDGDIKQSDIGNSNGLNHIVEVLQRRSDITEDINLVTFSNNDIIRNDLIKIIESLF
jgi:phosphate starvation-inducible PhoH-like protein